ncbi:phosphotransferase [Niallia circulans]|uniref:phosphotransferase n=1 Tax=Niallia circulans TaxID=1397 RepID=UPI00397CAC49
MSKKKGTIPWSQENYYGRIIDWIVEELDKVNLRVQGNIKHIKETDLTLLLRVLTNEDNYYFKAVGSVLKFEAALSKELYRKCPERTGDILAINETEGWLLMKDFKGEPLRIQKDKKLWQKAIGDYAELQISQIGNVDKFLQIGVPDRRMPILKEEINQYLEEMCLTGLSKEETNQILSLLPILLEMCDEMASNIPASIEHGDLHTNNIRIVENKFVFFDWGDASISHPFFSTRVFWHALDNLISSETEWLGMVEEFRPYYLEPWTRFGSMKEIDKTLRISDELACIQRALSWHLYITPNRQDKSDSNHKPSQWLRLLLEHRTLLGK